MGGGEQGVSPATHVGSRGAAVQGGPEVQPPPVMTNVTYEISTNSPWIAVIILLQS